MTSNNSEEIDNEEEYDVQASYIFLKFDDEEPEEEIDLKNMYNEEQSIVEENVQNDIVTKVEKSTLEVANQEVIGDVDD